MTPLKKEWENLRESEREREREREREKELKQSTQAASMAHKLSPCITTLMSRPLVGFHGSRRGYSGSPPHHTHTHTDTHTLPGQCHVNAAGRVGAGTRWMGTDLTKTFKKTMLLVLNRPKSARVTSSRSTSLHGAKEVALPRRGGYHLGNYANKFEECVLVWVKWFSTVSLQSQVVQVKSDWE